MIDYKGSVKLLKCDSSVNMSRLSFKAIDSHRVPAEKGFNSIAVINTDILVFGEILSNTIIIFYGR